MNKINEDIIIKDVLKGTTNATEISEVVKWFATDEGQSFLSNDIDDSIESLLQESDSMLASSYQVPSEKMLARINQRIRFQKVRRISLRIAAVMIPFVLLVGFMLYINSHLNLWGKGEYVEVRVPKGEQMQITFQDGSHAYLNSNTLLKYPKDFSSDERKVYLEGEGYFIIEKNPKCPFVVEMSDAAIHVLGTSFNVEAYPEEDDITLQLDKGSIKLTSLEKEYIMVPGERLTYNRQNKDCMISKIDNPLMQKKWEKNVFSFNNANLSQVLEDLKHWYDVDFQIEDSKVLGFSYTFESDKGSLEKILSDMEKVSPIRFQSEGKIIKVSMK